MAGVLPGVECARRRRSGWRPDSPAVAVPGGSRRSSICLYPTKVDSNLYSIFSLRSSVYKAYEDDKLGEVAREARERLDKRLRAQRNSSPKRVKEVELGVDELPERRWRTTASEWSMCLDQFKAGVTLVSLPSPATKEVKREADVAYWESNYSNLKETHERY